jgi:hypothetical protein
VLTAETVDEQGTTIVNDLDGVENSDFYEMKRETGVQREKYKLETNQRLLVGLAWIYVGELRLFRLFPKVFHVDATSHTNNEKRMLLTFSGRTSEGQTFVFLRVFLPNQKAYSFKWVFQVVLHQRARRCDFYHLNVTSDIFQGIRDVIPCKMSLGFFFWPDHIQKCDFLQALL